MLQTQARTKVDLQIYYHPHQEEIFFGSPEKKKVIAKGRRFGLTRGYAHRAIEYLVEGTGPGLWVDTVNGNIDRYVERYFDPILKDIPSRYWIWRQQRKELEIFGHKLDMRSADRPENIEGFGYKFIMMNEAGIILRNSYLYHNTILPMTLDFNPDFYIGGTPKGKGLFHELAIRADDPSNKDQRFFKFSSFDNPYLKAEDRQKLVDEIPKSIQNQEIYANFMEDSSTVFRNLKKCAVAISAKPISGRKYVVGGDLARLQDFSTIIVLDSDNGNMVYMDRFNEIDWVVQKERFKYICKLYNDAELWLDSTGVGDPIFEDLTRDGLKVQGFKFTNTSKKQLIQCLMLSLEQEKIQIFDKEREPNGKVLINEMEIFEYKMTDSGLVRYSAPEGHHDDCVIGLALANWGVQNSDAIIGLAIHSKEAVYQ